MGYLLGIDVGTTKTAAAIHRTDTPVDHALPEMVTLGDHSLDLPSVVFLLPDGSLAVGDAAERRAMAEPDRVAREFTRRIGDPTPVTVGERAFAAQELAAVLVRHVVDVVTRREGGPPERITVTHPAFWGPQNLDLLAEALAAALPASVELLSGPQAAAVCYAAAERVEPGSAIAVHDLGGGTFDAAVVRIEPGGGCTLLGRPEGVASLGGVDFDELVFEHVRAGAGEAFAGLDESDPTVAAALARLRRECRAAKEALSAETEVAVPVWLPGPQGGAQTVLLDRDEFERLIGPGIEDSVEALRRAVDAAGIDPAELSSVLLVGGSSRIPLVGRTVAERLGCRVAVDADPKHAIAKGAALAVLPRDAASWPAVDVPAQRPMPDEPDVERTGPIATVAVFRDDAPTERFAAVALLEPETRAVANRPGIGGTSAYVTQGPDPQPGPGSRAKWLIGAGGLAGALALVATVVFWPSSAVTLDGASARSIVPGTEAPTTAPPTPGATAPVAEPEQETTTDQVTGQRKRSVAPAPAAVAPPEVPSAPARSRSAPASSEPASRKPVVDNPVTDPVDDSTDPVETPPKDPCKPSEGSAPASCTATPPPP